MTFNLQVRYHEEAPELEKWSVGLECEGSYNAFLRPSLKQAMKEAEIRMNKRAKFIRKFPLGKVVLANGKRARVTV